MKTKLVGLWFFTRVYAYVCWRIIHGRTWNMLTADLEEPSGRYQYLAWRRTTGFEFSRREMPPKQEGLR